MVSKLFFNVLYVLLGNEPSSISLVVACNHQVEKGLRCIVGSDQLKISHTMSEFVFVSVGEILRVFVSLSNATDL